MSTRMPDFAMPSDDEASGEGRSVEPSAARRRPRRRLVGIAAVAAVAFVGGALAIGIPALQRDPAEQLAQLVDDYVAAVEAGDAEAAAALHMPGGDDADLALLGVAHPAIPAVLDCDAPEVDGDDARVRCDIVVTPTVENAQQIGTATIDLVRDGDWAIATGLEQRASLFLGAGEITAIGGAPVPEASGVTTGPLLLPGVHDITVATSPLLEPVGDEGLVVGPSGAWLLVAFAPAQDVLDEAAALAVTHVEACIASGDVLGDCDVPRLAVDARLEARLAPAGPGAVARGAAFLPRILVGEPGEAPQVEVVVLVRFASDLASYELAIESASAVVP